MARERWMILNGLWEYAITPLDAAAPENYTGKIMVPYPPESSLSGVAKIVQPNEKIWYHCTFRNDLKWKEDKLLLNFEACDWETTVWVNGINVGTHRGGYDPFSFDITGAMNDRGKQELLTIVPDLDNGSFIINISATGVLPTDSVIITVKEEPKVFRRFVAKAGENIVHKLEKIHPWSPADPYIYEIDINLYKDGKVADKVNSYAGLRKISLGKDAKGITRLMLNNSFVFQQGPLDQGFWPDGIYTPPTDDAMKYDLEVIKSIGFNMLRKHVKVENRRFYTWCDRMGLLVWQDIPSGWTDTGTGDVVDCHHYPEPVCPQPEEKRAAALGEFGGLGYYVQGHIWLEENWGYKKMSSADELKTKYLEFFEQVWVFRNDHGLSACIYTQITDVETETNGLMTYDRAVIKMNQQILLQAHQ
jgi:hypothetical protein